MLQRSIVGAAFLLALTPLTGKTQEYPLVAHTKDGKSVLLYQDGTWKPQTLSLENAVIRRSSAATKIEKSRYGFYEMAYDPSVWVPVKPTQESHEFEFQHRGDEVGCAIIAERIQMTQETAVRAVLKNADAAGKEVKVEGQSKAFVNGVAGTVLHLNLVVEGVYVGYYAYIWSGAPGTVQLTCWGGQNVIEEYKPIFQEFFGGFMLSSTP